MIREQEKSSKHQYIDEVLGLAVQLRLWRSFALLLILVIVSLCYVVIRQSILVEKASARGQVILSPAVSKFEIATIGKIPKSYIKAAFEYIAQKNSSWTYESIKESYQDLFENYYSHELETKIKANLEITGRFAQVKTNKMVSLYKINALKSEYSWCDAQNMACGIVTGKETLYIHHNKPFRAKEVSYLILAKMIYPTKKNPFSLKITRIVVGENEQ